MLHRVGDTWCVVEEDLSRFPLTQLTFEIDTSLSLESNTSFHVSLPGFDAQFCELWSEDAVKFV
jgi:hypothetical protein